MQKESGIGGTQESARSYFVTKGGLCCYSILTDIEKTEKQGKCVDDDDRDGQTTRLE